MHLLTILAIKGRFITLIATLAIVVIGAWTLSRLQVELFPDVDFPLITWATAHPGATAEEVLEQITIPLEGALQGVDGVETVRSTSSNGISLVMAEFEFGSDMSLAAENVSQNLTRISLPDGVQLPRAARLSPKEIPIFQLSVLRQNESGEIDAILQLINSEILPEFQGIPGVFSADIPMGARAGVTITRTNGWPSLPITVIKEPDANTVAVVDGITQKIVELTPRLPSDVDMVTVVNQAPSIQASIDSLKRESSFGALIAVAVIFAFLLSVRPTIVSSISIPVSILGALIVMGWQGMTLNMMTLGGLAIAVGRVVDDSIVVLENVYRHIQEGGNKIVATIEATKEVAGAITTSTLTTIAVFLPLAFIGGIIGTFFVPFALTVTYALLVSLVVALTVVPVLGSLFIRQGDLKSKNDTWLQRTYTGVIHWALSHKLATLSFALALFLGSFALLRFIPQGFLPTVGDDLLTAEMTFSSNASPDRMLDEIIEVEGILGELRNNGIVESFQVTMGGGGFSGPGAGGPSNPNAANLSIRLLDDQDIDQAAELLRNVLTGDAHTIAVNQAQGGPGQSNMLELVLTGNNYDDVSSTAQKIIAALQDVEGLEKIGDAENSMSGSAQISRVNGMRSLTISGSITGSNTQRINKMVNEKIEEIGLPEGVQLETGGLFADIREAFAQMARAMLFGIILIYLVMVVSMRSLKTPFVIILSLPLASIGALGALFITQRVLGLPALIGMLMLIGLVVTNAIVLVSFVEQLRAKGLSVYEALIQGGRSRLRPILMTAFTTSFALLPLAIVVTDGGIISAELATVAIGGLMTSTFLTLVVIPVVYSLIRKDSPSRGRTPNH
jgi:HAE1 family hydrophobic/amphiphilic exporter-1